jgi:hypothetical protein
MLCEQPYWVARSHAGFDVTALGAGYVYLKRKMLTFDMVPQSSPHDLDKIYDKSFFAFS